MANQSFRKTTYDYACRQIRELEMTIEQSKRELEMWQRLRMEFKQCETCHGEGALRDRLTENEWGSPYPCPSCGGAS